MLLGKAFVSVEDQLSTRPSASVAMLIGMCGQAITGPQDPNSGVVGGGDPPEIGVFMSLWISDGESARL